MPRFKILNVTCGSCAKSVAVALREVGPCAEAHADLDQRKIAVEGATADADTLDRVPHDAGWMGEQLAA